MPFASPLCRLIPSSASNFLTTNKQTKMADLFFGSGGGDKQSPCVNTLAHTPAHHGPLTRWLMASFSAVHPSIHPSVTHRSLHLSSYSLHPSPPSVGGNLTNTASSLHPCTRPATVIPLFILKYFFFLGGSFDGAGSHGGVWLRCRLCVRQASATLIFGWRSIGAPVNNTRLLACNTAVNRRDYTHINTVS